MKDNADDKYKKYIHAILTVLFKPNDFSHANK